LIVGFVPGALLSSSSSQAVKANPAKSNAAANAVQKYFFFIVELIIK
jgi:hypothetical protein